MSEEKKEEVKYTDLEKSRQMYKFTYIKDHGNSKKGDEVEMKLSTANALVAHKVGKLGSKVAVKKK